MLLSDCDVDDVSIEARIYYAKVLVLVKRIGIFTDDIIREFESPNGMLFAYEELDGNKIVIKWEGGREDRKNELLIKKFGMEGDEYYKKIMLPAKTGCVIIRAGRKGLDVNISPS